MTTRHLILASALLTLCSVVFAGCNEPEEGDECPVDVGLSGADFPCTCGDVTWDDLPPTEAGTVCTCDPDEGFTCESETPLCTEDLAEVPCQCGDELVEGVPIDGSSCTCDPTEGFVCTAPLCSLDLSELPCQCGDELVEALPGDGSVCTCGEEGFVCEPALSGSGSGE